MARYVLLLNWTDQGIREYQDTTKRAERTTEIARSLGGNLKELYWTLGPYDSVAVADFPDDEAATAFGLKAGSLGNIRTTTLRAFDSEELRPIIDRSASA
jgi:uncharacterized protein with GYD domain